MIEHPPMNQERFRRVARRGVRMTAILRIDGNPADCPVTLLDLGLGGARLQIEQALPTGTEAWLELMTPLRWDPLVLRSKVVWSRYDSGKSLVGLQFFHESHSLLYSLFELLNTSEFEGES
ncbi:MAG: PilZ domain protein [Deltaproteobacteria bacterium ADurb.Bin207]|nr:MAG: PilZ domain protein [Deltaproteobacteria bacterium ADurb.Bin207]HQB46480.1 PilZ domain-containing protein [Polyangiaceae bacterium]HQF23473.1 PilZ domain-containing protein [Polyangiaceae bacterium]